MTRKPHRDTLALLIEALGLPAPEHAAFVDAAARLRAPTPLATPDPGIALLVAIGRWRPSLAGSASWPCWSAIWPGRGHLCCCWRVNRGSGRPACCTWPARGPSGVGWRCSKGDASGGVARSPTRHFWLRSKGTFAAEHWRNNVGSAGLRLAGAPAAGASGRAYEPLPTWTLSPGQERRLMFEAVVRMLTNVAEQGTGSGVVLLLDDLQWAGPDALDLLGTLAHAAADIGLRLVGAYRDTEVGPQDPLSVTLADLAHAGLATRHALGPLAMDEAGQLLDSFLEPHLQQEAVGAERRERLVRLTGGVPFFLISYARAMGENADGWGAAQADEKAIIPWTVTQTVQQRVAALSKEARELLACAAVIGRVVKPTLLAAVTKHAESDLLAPWRPPATRAYSWRRRRPTASPTT